MMIGRERELHDAVVTSEARVNPIAIAHIERMHSERVYYTSTICQWWQEFGNVWTPEMTALCDAKSKLREFYAGKAWPLDTSISRDGRISYHSMIMRGD